MMRYRHVLSGLALVLAGAARAGAQTAGSPIRAVLTPPPQAAPSPGRRGPATVRVDLEARELVLPLADGVQYTFWTFGGTVPGSFIRVREGDLVEFHLSNHPASLMPHNVDLHAVTGPGGGAAASFVAPGHATTFAFRAIQPGLFVYHCATAPVGMHVANGMYGLILVEPAGGLPPADREFYVMQGEFYTDTVFGEPGLRRFGMAKALRELPDYVLFNGAVGALTGERALVAHPGERIRLFLGNGGPNLTSTFHIAGEVLDRVTTGASSAPSVPVQTLSLPPGAAAVAELTVEVPGTYVLMDHALFRAFNKGALGTLRVEGAPDPRVYRGRIAEDVYLLEGAALQTLPVQPSPRDAAASPVERREAGRRVFAQTCQACHQEDGRGVPGAFPPLAGSDFLNADPRRSISAVLNGLQGPITVNGRPYSAVMPALHLSDAEIADVLTYVYSQWGNSGVTVTPALVREIRLCPWCVTGAKPPDP